MAKKNKTTEQNIVVLPELESLLPPLTDDQLDGLERSLIRSGGPNDALWLWGEVLVDGHNRYRLCRKLELPFSTKQVWADAEDLEEVKYLMKEAGCCQRNMPPEVAARYRQEMVAYLVDKKNKPITEAVEEVAKATGVSARQIMRDREKVAMVNSLTESVRESNAVWALSAKMVKQLSLLTEEEQHAAIERAGYDGHQLAAEVRRMSQVEGNAIQNEEKRAKAAKLAAERAAEEKRNLWDAAIESLADATKRIRRARNAFGIKDGAWNRVYLHLTKVDEAIAQWRKETEESESKSGDA